MNRKTAQPGSSAVEPNIKIVVLDRGFVYVGDVHYEGPTGDPDWIVITNASNIRYWSGTEGLGRVALKGPNSSDKIDKVGTVRAPLRSLIHIIDTEAKLWI